MGISHSLAPAGGGPYKMAMNSTNDGPSYKPSVIKNHCVFKKKQRCTVIRIYCSYDLMYLLPGLDEHFNPQTARILTSHKKPTCAWEAQVLSNLYLYHSQFDITYHVWYNKNKTKNDQCKWIWVEIDCTFFINDAKAMYAFKVQVGPLCDIQILAVWI